jgi:MFS family permease
MRQVILNQLATKHLLATRIPQMDQTSANPYVSPHADKIDPDTVQSTNRLLPLWIWLAFAAVTSFFGTPADPISMLAALAYGLISFVVGAVLGSSLPVFLRVLPALLWAGLGLWLALSVSEPVYVAGHILYASVSIVIGAWTSRFIQRGRVRILAFFCTGYVLGSIVGIVGTVAGAVVATILAIRSLQQRDLGGDG